MSIARQMMMAAAGGAGGGGGGLPVEDVFSTDLYAGNSSTQTITNGIDLAGEGGFTWLKNRNLTVNHRLFDTERGMTFASAKEFELPVASGESNRPNTIRANSDGFSLGTLSYFASYNSSGYNYVAWTFRKAPRFFDVVTYTGDGVAGRTIPHNLGVEPGMIVVKRRDSTGYWGVFHRVMDTTTPEDYHMLLSESDARALYTLRNPWNRTAPTASNFTVSAEGAVNGSGATYVAYLFAHDPLPNGVIQCGSYTGNGSTNGPVINLGWEPQWLLVRRTDSAGDWWMYDSARSPSNPRVNKLLANSSAAEDTAGEDVDFISTGFQPKTTAAGINASGGNYVYVAIRAKGA